MDDQRSINPKIQYIEPPPIKWYGVSGDQLDRIKEACSQVGHDLSFALTALSVGLTGLITLLTVPQLTDKQQTFFLVLTIICGVVFLYTGIRWIGSRNKAACIIDAIRQSDQPETK